MRERFILIITLLFLLLLISTNAQLPDIILDETIVEKNNVILTWWLSNQILKQSTTPTVYGVYNLNFSIKDEILKTRNVITGSSFFDVLRQTPSKLNDLVKKIFKLEPVGLSLEESYVFEIYRNDNLIMIGPKNDFCKDSSCSSYTFTDRKLKNGLYVYYIKILSDKGESKSSNKISVRLGKQEIREVMNAYITLATTKDSYSNNERIELTDPPEGNNINKALQGTAVAKEFVNQQIDGYIIQFNKDPVLVKKTEIEKELKEIREKSLNYKRNYNEADKNIGALTFIYNYPKRELNKFLYSNSQDNYNALQESAQQIVSEYRNEFREEFDNNIDEVKRELNIDENNILRKFEGELFNGIVLDINEEQANELKKLRIVKEVFPNEFVNILLDKSVKVIRGDIVKTDLGLTGENITIAVIDTGIDSSHESLDDLDDNPNTNDPKIIGFKDFINFRQDPYDDNGHGTHVSGICCGTGGLNKIYTGVAPRANLVGVKVLNGEGYGTYNSVIAGMEWVAQNRDQYNIRIVSMSLGGRALPKNDPLEYAANLLVDYGITFVVAAGNSGPNPKTISTPGIAEKAITVGAIDNNLNIARFSSRGPTSDGRIKPDLSAPGVNIVAPQANTGNNYVKFSGTSMATPHVSGAIALIYQARPDFNDEQVKELLYKSALDRDKSGKDNNYGYGVINLLQSFVELNQPLHEISIYDVYIDKQFVQLNENVKIKVLIKNYGKSNENNLNVDLYINNDLKDSFILNNLNRGETKEVNFNYLINKIEDDEIKIRVQPVANEFFESDNEAVREIQVFESIRGRINAVVFDSWGTDYSIYSIFDELNEEWYKYGDYLVNIDYKSLNKEDITYQDILESKADVLIISDAWDNSQYTGNNWEYSDNEIEAIKKYVNEGHGIIATSGTFSELVKNNMKLAPLFGMDQNKIGDWANAWSQRMKKLYKNSLIFDKIDEDIYFTPAYLNNDNLELDNLQNSALLGISTDDVAKIIFNSENANNIYLTTMEELGGFSGVANNKILFYNAIVLASQESIKTENDLRLFDLEYDKLVYQGENKTVKLKIKNLGPVQNNIFVEILVNDVIKDSKTINRLESNEVNNIIFTYPPVLGINYVTISVSELPQEKNTFDNYLSFTSISPRAVIKNIRDYGVDLNNDNLYDKLILNITLDVIEEGYYSVPATKIYSNFGVFLGSSPYYGYYGKNLEKGENSLSLTFNGLDIRKSGLNGPYKVKDVYIVSGYSSDEYDYFAEHETENYNYKNFQSSSDLFFLTYGLISNKVIINKPLEIVFEIKNQGTEIAYDAILDVYRQSYNETKYMSDKVLVLHKDIEDIEIEQIIEERLDFTPDAFGPLNLIFVINSSNDFIQENNAIFSYLSVVPNGADLTGWLTYYGSIFSKVENQITVGIRNNGVKPATTSRANLYLVEFNNVNGSFIENVTLIQSLDTGHFAVDEEKYVNFTWIPVDSGTKELRMIIESPQDLNPNNNVIENSFYVFYNGPDIVPRIFAPHTWFSNEMSPIVLSIYNEGIKDANNVTANLYLENSDKNLIFNKFYEVIKINEYKGELINYIIDDIGLYILSFEIVSQDLDENMENNIFNQKINVILNEPDVLINYVNIKNKNFLVNEDIITNMNLYNKGTQTAKDVYLYAYLNNKKLLGGKFIGDILPNQNIITDLNIKLDTLGFNSVLFTVNSTKDGNLTNNNYYTNINVVPKSLIMNLDDADIKGYLLIKIEKRDLNTGKWELNNIVLDDLSRQDLRAIQPNSYLVLDKIFNPYNVIIDEAGNYRIYIAFRDDSGQVISTEAESGNNLEAYYEFNVNVYDARGGGGGGNDLGNN